MAKIAIKCPNCDKYVEASNGLFGLFATKKVKCSCSSIPFEVKLNKMASKKCPHCGNQVLFDQMKGEKAICPVCRQTLNTLEDNQKIASFSCAQCGIMLESSISDATCECPVCSFTNNVQERIAAEKIKKDGLASIIKYEGNNDTFVWKHPIEDFNYGSQLIVHETQEAIFFKDGQALDLFGPGRHTLVTQQLPLLEKVYQLQTDTEGTFHSEVYFFNKTVQMAIKWGTPDKVRFIDPLTGVPLELGASGEMNIQIADSRKLLLKLVGTMKGISWNDEGPGFTKSLSSAFRPLIANAVKTNLPSVIKQNEIDILEIDEKIDIISDSLKEKIIKGFEEYGLTICEFFVTSIMLPEDDINFKAIRDLHTVTLQMKQAQADATIKTAKASAEAQYRSAEEHSKAVIEAAKREAELERQTTETEIAKREAERKIIEAQGDAQANRIIGLTEAEVMRAKGYNQKDLIQADVQKAYAEGIGNMGPVVGGGGSSVMGDMLGLGVGMAAAGAIAPQINGMFQGLNSQMQPMSATMNQNSAATWDCSCGQKMIIGNFCNNCGAKKPDSASQDTWDCSCGYKGIIGNFCNNCGAKKPVPSVPDTWDCVCGQKGIIGNFCNNCGAKRGN